MSSGKLIINGVLSGSLKNEVIVSESSQNTANAIATAKSEAIEAAKIETMTQVNALADGQVKINKEAIDELETAVKTLQDNPYNDEEIKGLISALDTNKANKTQVTQAITDAVKTEEDDRKKAVSGVQSAVDTLSSTYATDKIALEEADANQVKRIEAIEARFTGEGSVEDMITTAKQEAIDTAESNAKYHSDSLNTAMNTRVETLETWQEQFQECSKQDILNLFANN